MEVDSFVVSTCIDLLWSDVEGEGFTFVSWDCDVLFSFGRGSGLAFSCEDVLFSFVVGSSVAFSCEKAEPWDELLSSLK